MNDGNKTLEWRAAGPDAFTAHLPNAEAIIGLVERISLTDNWRAAYRDEHVGLTLSQDAAKDKVERRHNA